MAHALSLICQNPIGGAGGGMLCTKAVLCWIRCVSQRLAAGVAPGNQVTAVEYTNFNTWMDAGVGAPPAKARSSQVFLGKMAIAKGTHKTKRLYQSNPRKGAIVIWENSNVAEHAAINGGSNNLYGYNQCDWLNDCGDNALTHCQHNVDTIIWDDNGLKATKSTGVRPCKIYYVGPKDAIAYFNQYEIDDAKW